LGEYDEQLAAWESLLELNDLKLLASETPVRTNNSEIIYAAQP